MHPSVKINPHFTGFLFKRLAASAFSRFQLILQRLPKSVEDKLVKGRGPFPYEGVTAVLVIQNGKTVMEWYGQGKTPKVTGLVHQTRTECWTNTPLPDTLTYGPDTPQLVNSATKSIIGLAFGHLLTTGLGYSMESLTTVTVGDLFDRVTTEGKPIPKSLECLANRAHPFRAITLHHLLSMTTGIEWTELESGGCPPEKNDALRMISRGTEAGFHPLDDVFSKPIRSEKVGTFNYCGGLTILMSVFIEAFSQKDIRSYLQETIFEPMNISTVGWMVYEKSGVPSCSGGLLIAPRDLIKFGELISQNGRYNEKQVVSEAFLREGTKEHCKYVRNYGYGYHIWRFSVEVTPNTGARKLDFVIFSGSGGQLMMCCPEEHIHLVINTCNYDQFKFMDNTRSKEEQVEIGRMARRLALDILTAMGYPSNVYKPLDQTLA